MTPRLRDCEAAWQASPTELYRDAHLLVVDKPAGWLTHPDAATERPAVTTRLGPVKVHQRLDVDTTGALAFALDAEGGATIRAAKKRYVAVVEGAPEAEGRLSTPVGGKPARTRYRRLAQGVGWAVLELWPETGRTHQLRVQLAAAGWPIRGDARHGEALERRAPRCLLHCAELRLKDRRVQAPLPPELDHYLGGDARAELREDPGTTCFREVAAEGDGWPGLRLDRYGDWLWMQRDRGAEGRGAPAPELPEARGLYTLEAQRDRSRGGQGLPVLSGEDAPTPLRVEERGVAYGVELGAQLSTGLFLDQRPQRAWLARHAGGMRVLNTFAHAGAFSVAAASAGAETVSVDLSRKWLERVPRQLALNGISPERHDCIYGDVFDWLRRLSKRGERFDLVILDPPSTSVGRKKKRWSAARDYGELVALARPLVAPGGWLWTSTNHRKLGIGRFLRLVRQGAPEAELWRICAPGADRPWSGAMDLKVGVWKL